MIDEAVQIIVHEDPAIEVVVSGDIVELRLLDPEDYVIEVTQVSGIGPRGYGVPAGGLQGQALVKQSSSPNDAVWQSLRYTLSASLVQLGGITAGLKFQTRIPAAGTIKSVSLLSDAPGSMEVDVRTCAFTDYPVTVSICGGNPPAIVDGRSAEDTILAGWDPVLAAGQVLEFYVLTPGPGIIKRLSVILEIERA